MPCFGVKGSLHGDCQLGGGWIGGGRLGGLALRLFAWSRPTRRLFSKKVGPEVVSLEMVSSEEVS